MWRFRHRRRRTRTDLTPDAIMRSVRASYDGLPYRHARGSRWSEHEHPPIDMPLGKGRPWTR